LKKVVILVHSPVLAPYSGGIAEVIKKDYNLNPKVSRVFLRDSNGNPIVTGSFLKGYVNLYLKMKNRRERLNVRVYPGVLRGKIAVFSQIRTSGEVFSPEVLLPGGEIHFFVEGRDEDRFVDLLREAISERVPLGGCGNRGFGLIKLKTVENISIKFIKKKEGFKSGSRNPVTNPAEK